MGEIRKGRRLKDDFVFPLRNDSAKSGGLRPCFVLFRFVGSAGDALEFSGGQGPCPVLR
jgi:hypothetical protein